MLAICRKMGWVLPPTFSLQRLEFLSRSASVPLHLRHLIMQAVNATGMDLPRLDATGGRGWCIASMDRVSMIDEGEGLAIDLSRALFRNCISFVTPQEIRSVEAMRRRAGASEGAQGARLHTKV